MQENHTCKICQAPSILFTRNIFDDRYGYPKLFDIYECTQCRSFITEPPMQMSEIGALYTNYYPRKNISSETVKKRGENWRKESKFRQWLSGEHRIHRRFPDAMQLVQDRDRSAKIKVLDVGCGDGSSLLELQSLGYEASGVETDMNLEKIKKNLGLDIFIGILEDAPFAEHSFDYIIANQVIEHVVDLENFAQGIAKFLRPGGTAIISTPNAASIFRKIYGQKWIHWHIPYHQQIMSGKSVANLFINYGLHVEKTETVSPSSWTVHEINRLRVNPKLGEKNPFWTPGEKINSEMSGKVIRKIKFILLSGIGKIADIFGQGNCLIVTFKNSN